MKNPHEPTAKDKLNSAAIIASAVIAGLLALVTGSAGVFMIAFVVLIGCSLLDRSLRL